MSLRLLKLQLKRTNEVQELVMPHQSVIIAFQAQREVPTIWFLGDTSKLETSRFFQMKNTGETVVCGTPENDYYSKRVCGRVREIYRGTIQLGGGDSVAHLFELEGIEETP